MTTSGSVDFSVSRDDLITDALIETQAVGVDDAIPATWKTYAARRLNILVKSLGVRRIGLWARKTGYILPVSNTNSVLLGPAGGHATTAYTQTTTSSDTSASGTSLTLSSTTGFADTQAVGVELEDGSMFWTTQSGAPVGSTITLSAGLTGAAVSGGYVYTYATKMQRPLRIVEAYRNNLQDGTDVDISVEGKAVYESQSQKDTEGDVVLLSYDPQLDNGVAYLWPRFTDGKTVVRVIFQRPFEDFDASTDTPDFPQEWYDALVLLLAVRCARFVGMPSADYKELRNDAQLALAEAIGNEPEEGSLRFQIDRGR